jgi:Kef-type K+ transport system membrane component KefB
MPDLSVLFLQLLVILLATRLAALLFRLLHQPEVLGEMLAGILLGHLCSADWRQNWPLPCSFPPPSARFTC